MDTSPDPVSLSRNPSGYLKLLKDQYESLRDAIDAFYSGNEARANDAAVRIRTLVHNTSKSRALLSFVAPDYLKLRIYHRLNTKVHPQAVFVLRQPVELSGDGESKFVRDDFANPDYALVPLEQWWTEDYLVIGTIKSSKRQVVLDLANKDGGAHVDPEVPLRHVAISEPPLIFGLNEHAVRPNLARATVAQAGNELLDYIERHFPTLKEPDNGAQDPRIDAIRNKLQSLKEVSSRLEEVISNGEAKEALLRLATYLINDVETCSLPRAVNAQNPYEAARWLCASEFELKSVEEQLNRAQQMVVKYGPSIRVVGN